MTPCTSHRIKSCSPRYLFLPLAMPPIPLSHHTHSGAHKLCYSSRNVLYFEHCCSSCAIIYWVWYTVKISCTTKENIQTTQIILRIVWKEWNVQEEKQSNEDEASDPICAEWNNDNTSDNDTQNGQRQLENQRREVTMRPGETMFGVNSAGRVFSLDTEDSRWGLE